MDGRACAILAAAALALGAGPAPGADPALARGTAAAATGCTPQPLDLARGVEILHAYRAYTGADGASHIETVDLKGQTGSYIGGTVKLTQFDFGDPTKVAIVYGFPDIFIPPHPAPYREIFIIIGGSSEIRLLDGTTVQLKPGSILIGEDLGSTGRGGRAGPCGYVAIDLQFKQDKPAP